jgi:AraC-like DNA-binding protein
MEEEKPYLNADLSRDDLSLLVKIPPFYLTEVLNRYFNENFFLYINHYRIEHVKKMLLEKKDEKVNILSVAFSSGFNSKSTFNLMFKRFTGSTPTGFIKKYSGFIEE